MSLMNVKSLYFYLFFLFITHVLCKLYYREEKKYDITDKEYLLEGQLIRLTGRKHLVTYIQTKKFLFLINLF